MEKKDKELIDWLVKEDEVLRKCIEEHQAYERQLEEYNKCLYLSTEQWMERKKIQKLKLAGRDKIEQILAEYRKAQRVHGAQSRIT